jgi:hypothetical protein
MAVKASALRGLTREVTIDFPGLGVLSINFRPHVYTANFRKELFGKLDELYKAQAQEPPEGASEEELEAYVKKINSTQRKIERDYDKMLQTVIASWDYLGEDDKPLTITFATWQEWVPDELQTKIWEAMRESGKPTPKASSTSSGSF